MIQELSYQMAHHCSQLSSMDIPEMICSCCVTDTVQALSTKTRQMGEFPDEEIEDHT